MPRKVPIKRTRCRSYVFTLNNPDGLLDFTELQNLVYSIYQEEMGAEGTPHFQGLLHFDASMEFSTVASFFEGKAHLERCRDLIASIDYCSKEDTRLSGPYETGERPHQGKRSDMVAVKRKLDEHLPESQIADEHFGTWIRYYKGFREYKVMKHLTIHRTQKTHVYIFYGPPGYGKSYLARHWDDPSTIYHKDRTKWWNDYYDHSTVVVDDMDGSIFSWKTFLGLMDETPFRVENKGGFVPFIANTLIFTTNCPPKDWYHYSPLRMPWQAFERRVTRWLVWKEKHMAPLVFDDYQDFLLCCELPSLV